MDWWDLLAVQGTLKSLLQHISSKASILWCSAYIIVQLSHPYMTTGKTIALTRQTFVGKVMLLLFNMLSRLVITFLPRSKHLLISWLQSPSAVILEPRKRVSHYFHYFPIYLPWSDGTGCHDLVFWMLSFKPTFSLSSFTFCRVIISPRWVSLSILQVSSHSGLSWMILLPNVTSHYASPRGVAASIDFQMLVTSRQWVPALQEHVPWTKMDQLWFLSFCKSRW